MARDVTPIDKVETVIDLLTSGDLLACCGCGWRLVIHDREVTSAAVAALKVGFGLGGRLVPMDDQLPGMPRQMAQTWRWARSRARSKGKVAA